MGAKIEAHINIIQFGSIRYSSKGAITPPEESKEIYTYQAPRTTGMGTLEFSIADELNLAIPGQEDQDLVQ